MNWTKRVGPGSLQTCLALLLLLPVVTFAYGTRNKKSESDLVFEEDNDGSELNLILTDKSRSANRNRNVHHEKHTHTKPISSSNTLDSKDRYEWSDGSNDADFHYFGGKVHHNFKTHTNAKVDGLQSLKKRKLSTNTPNEGRRVTTAYSDISDASRRRTARVPETDDEDLIYSGENGEGSGFIPRGTGGTDIYHYRPPTTTGRSDSTSTNFERRFFRITLTIGKSWTQALDSRSSSPFKIYHQELQREIEQNLGFDVETLQIIKFTNINEPGFVKCEFDLGLIGMSREQVEEEFFTYLEVGSLGNLGVQREGFQVRDVGAPQECRDGEILCRNGNCVNIKTRCNGVMDCGDGDDTDEEGCPPPPTTTSTTPVPKTTSSTRATVTSSYGGRHQGRDGCRADDQVRCSDGSPIFICSDEMCDGINHCPNGEDENPEKCRDLICSANQFQCDITKCISDSRKCDGHSDCIDGSDEDPKNCKGQESGTSPSRCKSDQFRCKDGSCIPRTKQCDGINDCPFREDELKDCPCTPTQFRCNSGFCIPKARQCDGLRQCNDGSDEEGCPSKNLTQPIPCSSSQFQCRDSGLCIARIYICDGIRNCIDGSDERNCPGVRPTTTTTTTTPKPGCSSFEFKCRDGSCVERSLQCDGYRDCRDGSDEGPQCSLSPDSCTPSEFRCGDGTCISKSLVCNGRSDCPGGRDDERNCREIPCRPDQFRCSADGGCIPKSAMCDGIPDCEDSFADETNCLPVNCRSREFRCEDGTCIPDYLKCDGRRDCTLGEDEHNCRVTCKQDQFTCFDGSCISSSYVCDKYMDCPDQSDESNCTVVPPPKPHCTINQFTCLAGSTHCIDIRSRCDNNFDCLDGSDELNCTIITTTPRPRCRPNEICDVVDYLGGLNLKTYPAEQTIKQGHEVVFQCRDEGPLRVPVRWVSGSGGPLPSGSKDYNGRLEMPNISVEHTGTYICEATGYSASTPGSRVSVYLRVDHSAGKSLWKDLSHYDFWDNRQWQTVYFPQSDPLTYPTTDIDQPPPTRPPSACGIHQATCSNGECIAKSMICDGDLDCTDGSDESRCHIGKDKCEPNEFQCENRRCIPKTWVCDGDDDCSIGAQRGSVAGFISEDEQSCTPPPIGSPCRNSDFRCQSGNQCIPKAFHCDKEIDCADQSDERGCSPPVIQRPPPPLITIGIGHWFNVSCTVVGQPIPEVVWRLNWGHIPSKCITSSVNGVGFLNCPDIQIVDQGAYSCEAINVLGSTFAIPDCILVVEKPPSVCGTGSFNDLAVTTRECLSCFCFGHTTDCGSTRLFISQMPPPEFNFRVVGVSQDLLGSGQVEIQDRSYVIPQSVLRNAGSKGIQISISNIRSLAIPEDIIPYFALPPSYNGNLLKAFGGHLRYTLRYRGSGRPLRAPDVIVNGNGVTLLHVGKERLHPGRDNSVSVRFWAGEWFKRVLGKPGAEQPAAGVEPASREEILMVLANVEYFLIRAQYDQSATLDTTLANVKVDYATDSNAGHGVAVYIEECRCPAGYIGISCENCAPGYLRHPQGPWLGMCVKSSPVVQCPPGTYSDHQQCKTCPCPHEGRRFGTSCYKDTDNQITCSCIPGHIGRTCEQCAPGYQESPIYPYDCRPVANTCDIEGSLSPYPDAASGRCVCKEYVTGPSCNQCKEDTFFLSERNQHGCVSCFCMGVTNKCQSSGWYRTQESSVFFNSPLGFELVDESQRSVIREGFVFDRNSKELGFKEFNRYPTDIYYWQLPYNYLGDKVTAYGGYLNYTVRYVPPPGGQNSPNTAADVEINGNDIRLLYFRKGPVPANKQVEISVPFVEQNWQRQDGQLANREHLMMALANLDALLIKATYTTSTREAHVSNVIMDYGVVRNTGLERAYAVEKCSCPPGYEGLSCEECAFGYTRSLRGLYLGFCEKCSCNDHSDECDPKTGICRNCRDYTTGDFCELCEDGYTGDPRSGGCRPLPEGRCDCDPKGSVQQNCPDGRNCICKGNVEGHSCNMCRRGTFALQEVNSQGCLECYCGAVTSECSSATLYRSVVMWIALGSSESLTLTDSTRTLVEKEVTIDSSTGEMSYSYPIGSRSERLFWSLPSKFTGNRLTSYGGKLRATRRYLVRPGTEDEIMEDIDVILKGNNGVTLFWTYGISSGQEVSLEVALRENAGWRHMEGGSKIATREDMLGVLSDIQAILIRASFTDEMEATYIKDVSLDDAVKHFTPNGLVLEVEECKCPAGYGGLSCESCSPGYYRDLSNRNSGPLGACLPCPCGDNAEDCRKEGGRLECICRPGFQGPNCESRADIPYTTPSSGRDREIQVHVSDITGQTVNVGGTASFRCSGHSSSSTQLRVSWAREYGELPSGRSRDDGRGLLVISSARPEDSGRYTCTVTDGRQSSIASVTLTVSSGHSGGQSSIGSRPTVSLSPRYTTVQVNEPVDFQCSASGVPPPIVEWSTSRGPVPSHISVYGNTLRISAARKSDAMEYICTARNNVGSESARGILYVQGFESSAPTLPPVGLVVSINPASYEARPGEIVRFRCSTPDRTAQIQWSKISGVLPHSGSQSPDGTLTLYSVRDVDGGIYVCSAISESGQTSQAQARLSVTVIGSPPSAKITPERQTVAQGNPIEIRCNPSGNPTPKVQWSKVGGSIPSRVDKNNEILRIEAAEVNDRGVYVCTVENENGKSLSSAIVEVERRESPLIEMYPGARQTVVRDGSALFQCRVVAGIPSPIVSWSRGDGRPLPRTVEEIEGGVLRFNRVTGEENGSWICKAENIVGTTSSVAQLEVQIPPNVTVSPASPHRVKPGQSVRLECQAEGDPQPMVQWIKLENTRDVEQNGHLGAGTPYFAIYDIGRVSKSDEGSYSCMAKSEAGESEERVQLLVDEFADAHGEYTVPHYPTSHSPSREEVYYFPVGSRADLRCIQAFEGDVFDRLYLDWSRSDGGRMPKDYDIRDGILYINDLTKDDAGRYICTATNRNGEPAFTIDARLEVVGTSPPRITLEPARQTVRRGDTVTITCTASGDQPITINWHKMDRRPFPGSVLVNGQQIVFRGIEVTDTGRYVCQATNSGGTSESVAEVTVNTGSGIGLGYTEPGIIGTGRREQKGRIGSTVELRCGVGGTHYNWRKDDEELPGTAIMFGPTLTLLNVRGDDAGRYICETEEGTDFIDLSVEGMETVRVRILTSNDHLKIGDDVELRCDVEGDSQPQIRWNKMYNGDFQDNVQISGSVLKIRDVRNENGGVYRCTASTVNGIYEEDYALTMQANPDRIQNSAPIETRSVPYGSIVTMDCKTDIPGRVEYTWSKQGGYFTQFQAKGHSFTISDVTAEDAGTYVCTASSASPLTSVDVTTVLIVTGAVPHFTQTPSSFMALSTLPDSYLKFDIDISFKPDDRNGMIIYNGQKRDGTGDFVSFGLSNGFPEFRFDVGSGPAVIRGDRPLDTGKWHKVQLSRNRANGTMLVNDLDSFSGSVNGKFQGLDLMEPLYVGGHPNFNLIHNLAGHSKGFVGCVSELVIEGKRQQLFKDSQTSRGVSSCETCQHNVCKNGGVCQEGLSERGYSCICPLGYSGHNCETRGESCHGGSCGLGKCANIPGGFECYCPFGKAGVRCERDVFIYEPKFNSDGFMAYQTPLDLKSLKVVLRVKPETEADGVLLYSSQTENGDGDYTSLAIRDKRVEFQYDTGSGPAIIRSRRDIVTGEWMSIIAERNLQDGELKVNDEEVVNGKSLGSTRGLNLKTPLYLGGYDPQRVQLNSHLGVSRGFAGCVSELEIGGMELDLINSILEGSNVDNCDSGASFCTKNLCKNGATCEENATCSCPTGYSGRFCENRAMCSLKPCKNGGTCYAFKNSYRCSCTKGFFGNDCETAMEEWSHSVAFRGEGYIEIDKSFMPRHSPYDNEVVELEVSTTSTIGLLLWHGPSFGEVDPSNFFAIGVNQEGKVEFSYDYGSGISSVISNKAINDGEKHVVTVKRQGKDATVQIDGEEFPAFSINNDPVQALNPHGNIYVGGLPNPYQMTHGHYRNGFIGCIHSLKILGGSPINLNENAISAINTGPCSERRKTSTGRKQPHHSHHSKHKKPNVRGPTRFGATHSKLHRNEVTDHDYTEESFLEGRRRFS